MSKHRTGFKMHTLRVGRLPLLALTLVLLALAGAPAEAGLVRRASRQVTAPFRLDRARRAFNARKDRDAALNRTEFRRYVRTRTLPDRVAPAQLLQVKIARVERMVRAIETARQLRNDQIGGPSDATNRASLALDAADALNRLNRFATAHELTYDAGALRARAIAAMRRVRTALPSFDVIDEVGRDGGGLARWQARRLVAAKRNVRAAEEGLEDSPWRSPTYGVQTP